MCQYCQEICFGKMSSNGSSYRDIMKAEYSSNDFEAESVETMVGILKPTPISKRKHTEDGLTSTIEVYVADDKRRIHHVWIPIKYCPVCGRDLSND